jgi:molybdopterin molybdotransferase
MAVSITEALNIIYINTRSVSSEIIPLEMALGRITAKDSIATFNLPGFDNSAMDGYAVKCADAGTTVNATHIIYAGDDPKMILNERSAIRIMTGAPVPEGCEAIVPFEEVEVKDAQVTLPSNIKRAAHIRRAGEDVKRGTIYLPKGEEINAYSITLLASQGITHVEVYRKITVAVFATGDELRPHFEKIEAHQLYNSNTPMFLARATELGCESRYIANSGDSVEDLEKAISSALSADIIITSGGMSVGDKDFTKEAFKNMGMKFHFDRVEIKPGKPMAFGTIDNTFIVNLPGNPLASMVNYEIFIRALIYKISGRNEYYHNTIESAIDEDIYIKKGKNTVTLGTFDGRSFTPLKKQLAGMVAPMQKADAMIITPDSVDLLKADKKVKILPISWNFTSSKEVDLFTQ